MIAFDAVVLAGGAGRRLAGVDKPALEIGDRSMLAHVLGAVAGAQRRIVVGPRREIDEHVRWCREDPPGAGPVAALAAALPLTIHDIVVVLAADLPWVAPAVPLLIAAAAGSDVAALADSRGRINFLAAAWRRDSLQRALEAVGSRAVGAAVGSDGAGARRGAPMRALFAGVVMISVADTGGWSADCDSWADVEAARQRASIGTPE